MLVNDMNFPSQITQENYDPYFIDRIVNIAVKPRKVDMSLRVMCCQPVPGFTASWIDLLDDVQPYSTRPDLG